MNITGLDVYRAYCQALLASSYSHDELAAVLYIPSNWEDEPEYVKAFFEDVARNINAISNKQKEPKGDPNCEQCHGQGCAECNDEIRLVCS